MVFETGIDVALPVELIDEVIQILVLLLGYILDQKLPRYRPALDHGLVHAEDVGAPLGFVGHQRTGGVQNARWNQPASAGLQAVSLGEIENAVVALGPTLQAAADVILGRSRFQAEKGIGE